MTNFDDPIATALRVARLLESAEIAYGLYGGLAVAAWGVPRETRDADLAVAAADTGVLIELLRRDGIEARRAFERVAFGGLVVSRATLFGVEGDTGLNTVDLVEPASARYAELAIRRVLRAPLRDSEISIVAPEDVVILKVLSTREKDLEDAASILHALENAIDVAAIETEVGQLAREIPHHPTAARWRRCRELPRPY